MDVLEWNVEAPGVPFDKKLDELFRKQAIVVNGEVLSKAQRFTINLCLKDSNGDIGFHFNPRFDQKCVVCNSLLRGKWGTEERTLQNQNPFIRGQTFSLEIFVTYQEFLVSVNGYHFLAFLHRISPININLLEIHGDVNLINVELTTRDIYPPAAAPCNVTLIQKLKVPYLLCLLDPPDEDTVVSCLGSIPVNADRFSINFCTTWSSNPDIAFHLSGRALQNYIACNIRKNGEWGQEEANCWDSNPLSQGHSFCIKVIFKSSQIMVKINGVHMFNFVERIPFSSIKYLQILGDIVLKVVEINSNEGACDAIDGDLRKFTFQGNLEIPFLRKFVDPITFKTNIVVCGVVHKDAIRFSIDFHRDSKSGSDIAFHFNPRFDQNYVARNCCIDNHWGHEEGHTIRKSPFIRGKPFSIEIFVTRNEFLVSVDGKHFCEFAHRVMPSEIKHIEIQGDVTLDRVELSTKDSYPSCDLPKLLFPAETPVVVGLKERLEVGTVVEVVGRVKLLPVEAYFNLQAGRRVWPHPTVAFHLSVRFSMDTLVLNSWEDTGWGREEVYALCGRILPGANFSLGIQCRQHDFLTVIDGHPFNEFKHRAEPRAIDTLHIQGDVIIHNVKIRDHPSPAKVVFTSKLH